MGTFVSEASARFRDSRLRLPPLGFGAAPIGNLYAPVDEDDAQAALQAAWRGGLRHFDTAPFYGYGLSERRLGRALADWPKDSFSVSTKVGRIIEADAQARGGSDGFAVSGGRAIFDYGADGVRRSFEGSLQRLGVDRVGSLFLHDIGRLTHGERHPQVLRRALDEALPAMAELRAQGAVGAVGIGVNEVEVCLEVLPRFDLDCIMLAGRYTLFEQVSALPLLDEAHRRGVHVLVAGPYNSGLLGDPRGPGATYDYQPAGEQVLRRARGIYAICAEMGVDVGAAALQFPMAHPAVKSVIAGMRTAAEVECAIARRDRPIPTRAWEHLQSAGIIAIGAPLPGQKAA